MAITYFQDTIFSTESTLTAPAVGSALQVAVNNTFSTSNYTFIVTVASVNCPLQVECSFCRLYNASRVCRCSLGWLVELVGL